MSEPDTAAGSSAGLSAPSGGHGGCRMEQFARWNRIMLEHEREHLSRVMKGRAFMFQVDIDAIMHDLADIDAVLALLPPRVETENPQ